MPNDHSGRGHAPQSPVLPVQVLRCDAGGSFFWRGLSEGYSGLWTHFVKGRGHYCRGETCHPAHHREARIWKGYLAGERWNCSAERWEPGVLELTESLELDFRGVYQRGQVWEISRGIPTKKTKPPIVGRMHEQLLVDLLPPAFDYVPVLVHLYRVFPLDLSAKNPMPPRVALAPSAGAPPSGTTVRPEEPASPEQLARMRDTLHQLGIEGPAQRIGGVKPNGVRYYR